MKHIASRLQLHRTTVGDTLRREGVSVRQKGLTEKKADLAERLYASGYSLATVGRKLNVDPTTIRNILLKRGVALRDPQGRSR